MEKGSCKMFGLKYPASDKIKSRTSTIARAMASSLAPRIPATEQDKNKICSILHIDPKNPTCVYCGRKATHLDHLHSLITNIRPTGYYTEPANLVPCCNTCNQPKGALNWKEFMENRKDLTNQDGKLEQRKQYLHDLEKQMPAHKFDFEKMEGFSDVWDEYLKLKESLANTQNKIDDFINNYPELIEEDCKEVHANKSVEPNANDASTSNKKVQSNNKRSVFSMNNIPVGSMRDVVAKFVNDILLPKNYGAIKAADNDLKKLCGRENSMTRYISDKESDFPKSGKGSKSSYRCVPYPSASSPTFYITTQWYNDARNFAVFKDNVNKQYPQFQIS